MAAPVSPTRAQYRLEVRRLLHDATGKFWSDSDLNDYIDDGRRRVCSDTGCLRRLVVAYISKGLEQYPIGGVTGGLVSSPGGGYTFVNILVIGDGSGATATGVLSPIGTATPGGSVVRVLFTKGGSSAYTVAPAIGFSGGGGSGAAATAHMEVSAAGLVSIAPGAGYVVGDVLTLVGGSFVRAARVMVATVAGGQVGVVELVDGGEYLVPPPQPSASTGGSGAGATFIESFNIQSINITDPGKNYVTPPAVSITPAFTFATAVAVLGATSSVGGALTAIIVTNPGINYTFAAFTISGDGFGAAATAGVIPADSLDIMNVTPIWGNLAPPLNYQPWTEFNAKMRLLRSTNQMRPAVWSRYGTSGGAAFLQPIPDQTYTTEFDTAILPQLFVDDVTPDSIQFPFTSPVAYYAAWKAKLNQQQFVEAQAFLNDYGRKMTEAQRSIQMRRIPNPYGGYSGG